MSEQHTWVNCGKPEECEHEKGSCSDCPFYSKCNLPGKEIKK